MNIQNKTPSVKTLILLMRLERLGESFSHKQAVDLSGELFSNGVNRLKNLARTGMVERVGREEYCLSLDALRLLTMVEKEFDKRGKQQ